MSELKVEIISLKGDHQRKRFQEAQMRRLGLTWGFIDATRPDDLPEELIAKMTSAWARPLRQTEVALTHSHLRAWQRVIVANCPTLILEDDAVLCGSLPQVLSELSSVSGLELVQLETFMAPKLIDRDLESLNSHPYKIGRLYRDRAGAAAYLLWPKAAKKLVHSVREHYPPADAAIHLAPNIIRHQIVPACALQAMHVSKDSPLYNSVVGIAPSSVSTVPKPGCDNWRQWLRHKMHRLSISWILLCRKICSLRKGEYRLVEFTGE